MLFSSMVFLWCFLPVVFVLYFILGKRLHNTVLLLSSLLFYAWGEPGYILLMLFSIGINYIGALGVASAKTDRSKKWFLGLNIAANLCLLGYFKYWNMVNETIASLNPGYSYLWIALPIGISFYTFQAMSYVVDVYRGDCQVQRNPFKLGLYISFFPQLIAGPIVKYHDICLQLDSRQVTLQDFSYGVRRFVFGLAKKVLLANQFALVADNVYSIDSIFLPRSVLWLGAVCYMFQIYFDFSGYSDMAIGLGRMFGFKFMENFNYPYLSRSITEFWRRWHISLSTWFKEYLYIPLGGNRKGIKRTYINLMIVFIATGFWHGAAWNFVLWGIYHGCFLLFERKFGIGGAKKADPADPVTFKTKCQDALLYFYTMGAVFFGWILFRADSLKNALRHIYSLFFSGQDLYPFGRFYTPALGVLLIIAFFLCGPFQAFFPKLKTALYDDTKTYIWEVPLLILLFAVCIVSLTSNSYNPFIYFRF